MSGYLTIASPAEYSFEIKRSKFICRIIPISDIAEGAAFREKIARENPSAAHNCYAAIGTPESNEMRFSDDGEPQGTAGQPMLEALKKSAVFGIAAVVTRYFGGIKLGAAGLLSAYTKAVADCLKTAETAYMNQSSVISAQFSYAEFGAAERALADRGAIMISTQFSDGVSAVFVVPLEKTDETLSALGAILSGGDKVKVMEKKYFLYKRC